MLYMFRTILVHHQEQLYRLYIVFGTCRYHTSGCCVTIATQQPHVWYRHVPAYTKCDVQLTKLLLMMDQYSPKHVDHLMENEV